MSIMIAGLAAISVMSGSWAPANSDLVESALQIAHAIARHEGYTPSRTRQIDIEITDEPKKPAYPGFVTVQIRSNSQTAFDVSVGGSPRIAADFLRCLVFAYPIRPLKTYRTRGRYVASVMRAHGCSEFKTLSRRGDGG
jgi:hypothetical protein